MDLLNSKKLVLHVFNYFKPIIKQINAFKILAVALRLGKVRKSVS